MIDILTGRCTFHGWLSDAERKAGYCIQCEEPELFGDFADDDDYPGEDIDGPL